MLKSWCFIPTVLITVLLVLSCKKDAISGQSTEEKKTGPTGTLSDLIHNPVRADGTIDSSYLPILTMDESEFDFGIINEGDIVEHTYSFTNTGTAPLLILNATSTCGCTVPEWPDKPIATGEKGNITVKFDAKHKEGSQNKEVTIFANTFPNKTTIRIKGKVQKLN